MSSITILIYSVIKIHRLAFFLLYFTQQQLTPLTKFQITIHLANLNVLHEYSTPKYLPDSNFRVLEYSSTLDTTLVYGVGCKSHYQHNHSRTHMHKHIVAAHVKKSWRTTPLENKLRTVHRVKWQDGCLITSKARYITHVTIYKSQTTPR